MNNREEREKWIESEYVSKPQEYNGGYLAMVFGKLARSKYEYEIFLVSENPERWRVFPNSYGPKAVEVGSSCDGDTPRACLEKVVAVDEGEL
jgi:hypothetical protein